MSPTLSRELDELQTAYVAAVNAAVNADDLGRAEELASQFDLETLRLLVAHGEVHPVTLVVASAPRAVRRVVQRVTAAA